MSAERRLHPRSRLLQRARIVFRNGYSTVDCVVLDISTGGARLKLAGIVGLPTRFELRLDNGLRRLVEVCYRSVDAAGVRFVDSAATA